MSGLLSQNPTIHAEGGSGLCQIMWDTKQSCTHSANQQLSANYRSHTMKDIVSQIPHSYYKGNNPQARIVVDKCRAWTLPDNVEMLNDFIGKDTKIIVLVRPLAEIVRSFVKLYKANDCYTKQRERDLLLPNSEPVMRSLAGVHAAQQDTSGRFLFVSYKDLVETTAQTLKVIYEFCGWEPFIHNTNNIKPKHIENDYPYGLKGQHTVRKKIGYCDNHAELMDETTQKCMELDNAINLNALMVKAK